MRIGGRNDTGANRQNEHQNDTETQQSGRRDSTLSVILWEIFRRLYGLIFLENRPETRHENLLPVHSGCYCQNGRIFYEGGTMPRMSKKMKKELAFFLNERGRRSYNELCRKCQHDCKQSFRAVIIDCPRYLSKRSKRKKEDTD